jgi:hypothetical protein
VRAVVRSHRVRLQPAERRSERDGPEDAQVHDHRRDAQVARRISDRESREPADDEPRIRPGERRLCDRHGSRSAVCATPSSAARGTQSRGRRDGAVRACPLPRALRRAGAAHADHRKGPRMLVVYAALLLTGSVLAASAQSSGMYIAGRVLQGLCTSLLLIAAVPPTPGRDARWPPRRPGNVAAAARSARDCRTTDEGRRDRGPIEAPPRCPRAKARAATSWAAARTGE